MKYVCPICGKMWVDPPDEPGDGQLTKRFCSENCKAMSEKAHLKMPGKKKSWKQATVSSSEMSGDERYKEPIQSVWNQPRKRKTRSRLPTIIIGCIVIAVGIGILSWAIPMFIYAYSFADYVDPIMFTIAILINGLIIGIGLGCILGGIWVIVKK
jgi:uncharacterized membrane protein YcjF (UPF0283 family)